ncbi:heme exporter protein CcmD [Pseudoxanthomonas kalamensis DSM 18571]|uniref:heme exporter protein CcmD n=1 Tax=Pseudoxanthomonas kalamensis TaxID=289483 RepID=UPI001390D6D6|nr:heme exporter protein CcmD [Pseudoxanthomonas kalamensis]KAF1710619.1 heme exporter protein CcmD [Pseudoxanthomonas kalamensis DSM 18571]
MNYLSYVIGAYAVFAVVLLWDWLSPKLQIRRVLRSVRMRVQREQGRRDGSVELHR